MKNQKTERRKHPRSEVSLPLKITKEDFDIITETKNISCAGAYCQVNRYLPLMSKVALTMYLPNKTFCKTKTKKITCNGVVVRIEPVIVENTDLPQHNVAIFFTDLSEVDKNRIVQYVNYNLAQKKESLMKKD